MISVLAVAMAKLRWNQKHLAGVTGFCEAKISRIMRHPLDQKFSDLAVVAKKLKIDSLPIF